MKVTLASTSVKKRKEKTSMLVYANDALFSLIFFPTVETKDKIISIIVDKIIIIMIIINTYNV